MATEVQNSLDNASKVEFKLNKNCNIYFTLKPYYRNDLCFVILVSPQPDRIDFYVIELFTITNKLFSLNFLKV
jgi:hypothetical protein